MTNPGVQKKAGTGIEEIQFASKVASPGRLALRRFLKNRTALFGLVLLGFLYTLVLFGSFFMVRPASHIDLNVPNHPPTMPRFVDENNKFHLQPFVYGMRMIDPARQNYKFDLSKKYSLGFISEGQPYKLWWLIPANRHLITVEKGGLFAPFGTDGLGRCVYSRVIQGAKISLSIGLVAIAISVIIGMTMGGIAGYFGGWTDRLIMRVVEFLLSIPTLYLIIALRAYFQSEGIFGLGGDSLGSTEMFIIIVIILSMIGWAVQARVIRGMVLSIRENDFVMAERALGASTARILWRHILPNTMSYVIISASIAVPGYILAEVALSYLGVGIQDPEVSWGLMLEQAQSVSVLKHTPWQLFAPASAIFLTVMAFNFVGDGIRDALDPKHTR